MSWHYHMLKTYSFLSYLLILLYLNHLSMGFSTSLTWSGGPLHLECELTADLLKKTGQHIRENVVAVNAVSYKDRIYILTPRLKKGVFATVTEMIQGRHGPELMPYPTLKSHTLGDCDSLQNAVDFYLDTYGILWVLDSGIVETLESPRCMCSPKVVAINLHLNKMTKYISLSSHLEPSSLLQNIVVDYSLGTKPYIYISDASRGAVIVHDVAISSGWTTLVCAPAGGMQLAVIKRPPAHSTLVIVRVPHSGLIELDTGSLKRSHTHAPLRVFGEHSSPVLLLGTDPSTHKVYMRYNDEPEVLSWDSKSPFNSSLLTTIHTATPSLRPTSVNNDPLRPNLIILESNYGGSVGNLPTYHRLVILSKL